MLFFKLYQINESLWKVFCLIVLTGDYVINGSKLWITNGLQADWICLLVNTSEGLPHQNKSLICVPLNMPGVQRVRNISKIGMLSSDTAELFFEDVRVPQSYRIGQEGMGFAYQMLQFVEERVFAGASGIPRNFLSVLYNIIYMIMALLIQGKIIF